MIRQYIPRLQSSTLDLGRGKRDAQQAQCLFAYPPPSLFFKSLFSLLLYFLFSLSAQTLHAQQPLVPAVAQSQTLEDSTEKANKRVKILHADFLTFQRKDEEPIQKLIGKVRMQQDSTLFYCDSAYFYENANKVEAFSHVRVVMKDGAILTGDRLEYEGDTKIAKVRDRVKLVDGDVTLKTDRITYYREDKYGYYDGGGELQDEDNTLTSQYGYYYSEENMAYFKNAVRLENPDYVLETDTLGYNTDTEEAFFLTYTLINSDDGTIETTNGRYDTKGKFIYLYERSTVRDSAYTLTSDTLIYDDATDIGKAWGNVIIDRDTSLTVLGEYGEFRRRTDESIITEDAVAIQMMADDTLYMFADTLYYVKEKIPLYDALPDSLVLVGLDDFEGEEVLYDSLGVPLPDSLQPALPPVDSVELFVGLDSTVGPPVVDTLVRTIFRAYPHVRLFMNDLQGRADSLVYFYDDSLLQLYDDPVLWSEENQMTGDSVKVFMKNDRVDSMWVGANGFLVSREDTVGYNQVKGKEIRAKFRDNELHRMHVIGNAESLYFARNDSDTIRVTYDGVNQASSQEMLMYFANSEPDKIVFLSQPEGKFMPFFMALSQQNQLEGMKWRISEKPEKPRLFDPTLPALPTNELETLDRSPAEESLPIPQSDSDFVPPGGQNR